jgi:hypothetical protein
MGRFAKETFRAVNVGDSWVFSGVPSLVAATIAGLVLHGCGWLQRGW